MRCKQAREFYFKNRDGLLSESDRMKLEEHLSHCDDCASFVREMDMSLGLLGELEEMSPSEGFEWNVKRRILQEKTRMLRESEALSHGGFGYFAKFAVAGIAAAAVVLVAAFIFVKSPDNGIRIAQKVERPHADQRVQSYAQPAYTNRMRAAGVPSGAQPVMVSSEVGGYPTTYRTSRRSYPFETIEMSYNDSLLWENALLKKKVEDLQKQVIYLRRVIDDIHNEQK
ncbi:MAG: hypothetical protein B6D63_01455 [Candidatus Latescibacteria bacterium 4484_7]|nr:MAG: hypothetical protein B6D63_01455 [Candidatus Latescibacteria bacterium 4484_7]RKZ06921.1 MAG: hypothetical protein DRQ05_03975 [bacterium]